MPRLFISYRRDDSQWVARSICGVLGQHFGVANVFFDLDTINPGDDFVSAIEEAVSNCDALIALVGMQWLDCRDGSGNRRIQDPNDFIRLEIATALRRNIRVIPVLVDGARMPRTDELPGDLAVLARRQGLEVSANRFHRDVQCLIASLEQAVGAAAVPLSMPAPPTTPHQGVGPGIQSVASISRSFVFQPGHTVGIDLGTTFSTLAILDEQGNPTPIANEEDDVETPSLILLVGEGHVIVGPNRTRAALEDPVHVVERIKRYMGNVEYKRTFDGREITPEFLSALILKKLRQDAEKRIGKIGNAVITVPYYFNDAKGKATQDAGRMAGLNVIDIINEPTAATLTYAWDRGELGATDTKMDRPRLALVYDLGGGTFDVTVVRYSPNHFQVLATDGDTELGGIDWNDRLLDYVAEEFKRHHGVDPRESPQAVQMLRNECDLAKIALTDNPRTVLTFRHHDKSIGVPITREDFEKLTADLLQRTIDTVELVIEQAKITPEQLDAVVLVGGSTLMPVVPAMIKRVTGKEPYKGLSPHTAVAQGAAIHAAILEARHRGGDSDLAEKVRKHLGAVHQENVNSHGLGIIAKNPKTGRNVNKVMISRNSRLPVEVSQVFRTVSEGQIRVNVIVTEGDSPDPRAVDLIGNCRVTDLPPGLPKGSPVEVTYAFDKNGRVRVSAHEESSGREAAIEIERQGCLTDAEVDAFTNLVRQYKVE